MLRVMPVDDEIWTLRDLEVLLAYLWMNVCNEQNVDCSFSVHHGIGGNASPERQQITWLRHERTCKEENMRA